MAQMNGQVSMVDILMSRGVSYYIYVHWMTGQHDAPNITISEWVDTLLAEGIE